MFASHSFFVAIVCLAGLSGIERANATPDCPQGHCAAISSKMNEHCIANGYAGRKFMVFGPDGNECFCPCSCVASDTLIETIDAPFSFPISELITGTNLKSPFSILSDNGVSKMLTSEFSETPGKVRHMRFSNGSTLVVSPEHSFVAPNNRVLAAEELKVGQSVLDGNHKEVVVLENGENNEFRGKLMNLIINDHSKDAKNHFIVTNTIMSGDWLVQSNYASFKADIDARLGVIDTFNAATTEK